MINYINKNRLISRMLVLTFMFCIFMLCSNKIFAISEESNIMVTLSIILPIIIPIIFAFIALYWKFNYGENSTVSKTVEQYPPKEYSSAEIAFFYKGNVGSKDIITLVIHLANKGYLRIEDDVADWFIKSKAYKFIKLKEYDGDNEIEEEFFNSLFEDRDETIFMDLQHTFKWKLQYVKRLIISKKNKAKIFVPGSMIKKIFIGLMIVITNILITVRLPLSSEEATMLVFQLIFPITGFIFLIVGLSNRVYGKIKRDLIIMGVVFTVFGIMFFFMICSKGLIASITYIIGMICVYIMTKVILNLRKGTEFGNEIFTRIDGYIRFIKTAPKNSLEELVIQNPNYFYESLPYVHALGISNTFIFKLKNKCISPPTWYNGSGEFDFKIFSRIVEKCMISSTREFRDPNLPW